VFGSLLTVCTTGKCPAFRLVSRPYRIGYSALAVLVLVMLPPLSFALPPFELICPGEASVQVGLDAIQLLRCFFVFPVSSSHKKRLCDTCKHSDIDIFLTGGLGADLKKQKLSWGHDSHKRLGQE